MCVVTFHKHSLFELFHTSATHPQNGFLSLFIWYNFRFVSLLSNGRNLANGIFHPALQQPWIDAVHVKGMEAGYCPNGITGLVGFKSNGTIMVWAGVEVMGAWLLVVVTVDVPPFHRRASQPLVELTN